MDNYKASVRKNAGTSAAWLLMFLAGAAVAAPVVQQASGTFNHKGMVTITGSGFGSKATATPVIWDDCSVGTYPTDAGWTGSYPNVGAVSDYLQYRTPIRGVALPHTHITKYMAGAHSTDSYVTFWKARSMAAGYPQYTYLSYYHRADPAWVFGGDNNYKTYDFSTGVQQNAANNLYSAFIVHPNSNTDPSSNIQWLFNDDAYGGGTPTLDNNQYYWGPGQNPMAGWTKNEWEIKWTPNSDGYIKMWENGVLTMNYKGPTDKYPGTARTEAIGGYARNYPQPNNWRYLADIYYDQTPSRVVLANNSNLSNATIVETQIPSTWSNTSINISVNLGKFSSGQTAYLFVVDSSGAPSATGLPVTVGGSASPSTLTPPANLHVL